MTTLTTRMPPPPRVRGRWQSSPWLARVEAVGLALALVLLAAPAARAIDDDSSGLVLQSRFLEGLPYQVVYADPYLYVGLDTGVEILDLTDPTAPLVVSHYYRPSPAYDLDLVGNRLYVANGEVGVVVLDVADPVNPALVREYRQPAGIVAEARGIDHALVGGVETAFVAEAGSGGSSAHGLRIIDLTVPAPPDVLWPLDNGALDVEYDPLTGYAYAGLGSTLGGRQGLVVIDPGIGEVGYLNTFLPVNELRLSGAFAYLATGTGSIGALKTASLATPTAPALADQRTLLDAVEGLALRGGDAFLAAGQLGLVTWDVSDPFNLLLRTSLGVGREAFGVATSPGAAFVATRSSTGRGDVRVVAAPTAIDLQLGADRPYAEAPAVAVGGTWAYALRRDALHIVDITDPAAPVVDPLKEWSQAGGDYSALDYAEGTAALAEGTTVHLIDVIDPLTPSEFAIVTVPDGVAVQPVIDTVHRILWVTTGVGLVSFDLDTRAPGGSVRTAGWATDFAVVGDHGYLVAGDELHVVDVAPVAITFTTVLPGEQLFAVDAASDGVGDLIVATGQLSQLYTLTAISGGMAVPVGSVPGRIGDDVVLLDITHAAVAARRDGVRVFDLAADLVLPPEVAFYDHSGVSTEIAADGQTLVVAGEASQFWVFDCPVCPTGCAGALQVRPNSLKMVKLPVRDVLSWEIQFVGSGTTNIHRKDRKADPWVVTPIGSSATTTYTDPFLPTVPPIAFYAVFGADCSGNSVIP